VSSSLSPFCGELGRPHGERTPVARPSSSGAVSEKDPPFRLARKGGGRKRAARPGPGSRWLLDLKPPIVTDRILVPVALGCDIKLRTVECSPLGEDCPENPARVSPGLSRLEAASVEGDGIFRCPRQKSGFSGIVRLGCRPLARQALQPPHARRHCERTRSSLNVRTARKRVVHDQDPHAVDVHNWDGCGSISSPVQRRSLLCSLRSAGARCTAASKGCGQ
jgi:hypothetical protein